MQWVDTHAHIDTPRFGDDPARREAALRARDAGIAAIVIPGIEPLTWSALLSSSARLREQDIGVCFHTALGVHPQALPDLDPSRDEEAITTLEQHLAAPPPDLVAIGECGLDFGPLGEGAGASRPNVQGNDESKHYVGSYLDENFLIPYLTPNEYFRFVGKLHNYSDADLKNFLEKFEDLFHGEITGKDKYIGDLSKGNLKKVGIAASVYRQSPGCCFR